MSDKELPYISVIVIAYNRKDFLLNAIKSVVNQTLDKKYYEIIVVKNFRDNSIDDFIGSNNITNIYSCDITAGGKLIEGIRISKGYIISFLEDDDKFKNNINLCYYHNLCIPINSKGEPINITRINTSPDFNMSSISIKKSIIKINNANKSILSWDTFMYLFALESNTKILNGKEKLTFYMFHNSLSNIVVKNFEEYRKRTLTLIEEGLKSYYNFAESFNSNKSINFINARITGSKINGYLYGLKEKPENLINYILNNSYTLKFRIKFLTVYILIKINPNFRQKIYKKAWNNYKNYIDNF